MTSGGRQIGRPSINHIRVLQWIARHERDGTTYAPKGMSHERALDLLNYGLATPIQGHPGSRAERFAVTQAGQSLLDALDRVAHADKHFYWLRTKVKN